MVEFENKAGLYFEAEAFCRDDLIDMIGLAAAQAERDIAFYAGLNEHVMLPFDKELINNIRLDKIKLLQYLEEIYFFVADIALAHRNPEPDRVFNLNHVFKKQMFDELENIEFVRRIYSAFADNSIRDKMLEVILDGQTHTHLLAYLYNEYK